MRCLILNFDLKKRSKIDEFEGLRKYVDFRKQFKRQE